MSLHFAPQWVYYRYIASFHYQKLTKSKRNRPNNVHFRTIIFIFATIFTRTNNLLITNMITFLTSALLLVVGYLIYGAFVEKVFGADANRPTPCRTQADGVAYIEMPTWRIYLIQLPAPDLFSALFRAYSSAPRLTSGLLWDASSAALFTTTYLV